MNPDERTPSHNGNDYWDFLTNHAAVLLHVAENPDDTIVEIASLLRLRERAVAAIIADLRRTGYLEVERRGRQNHYSVNEDLPLRRPAHAHLTVRSLLTGLKGQQTQAPLTARAESQKLRSIFGA